jgi:DNA-binding response OmpR family regulator
MPPRAIVVEPNPDYASRLVTSTLSVGWDPDVHTAFPTARQALVKTTPDAVISNIRLGAFNGIQLAYLAKQTTPGAVLILYSDTHDHVLVKEARIAGAFYEAMGHLPFALPAYLTASLPVRDRRQAVGEDRRQGFRGGPPATDVAPLRGAAITG